MSFNSEDKELDKNILKRLTLAILHTEKKQIKTKNKREYEINEEIRSLIKREVLK